MAAIKTNKLPWSDLGFLHRQPTTLTLVNASDETIPYYHRKLQDEFYCGGSEGALPPGDSVVFPMELWRPECTYLYLEGLGSIQSHLFPGFDRTLVWKDGFSDQGPHAITIYDPMRLLNQELKQQGPDTPLNAPVETILAYYQSKTDYFDDVTDRLLNTGSHPGWVPDILQRQAHFIAAGEIETIRGYQRMVSLETFELPLTVAQRMDSMLADVNNVPAPNYRSLLYRRMHNVHYVEDALPSPLGASHRMTQLHLTNTFLSTSPGMLAAFLEGKIRSSRQYGGKDDLIESGIASLPPDYQEHLITLQQTVANKHSNDAATLSLLNTAFQTPDGSLIELPSVKQGQIMLYKFWFPGCRPCAWQHPYERRLLAEFPDLRLTYIGYLTTPSAWKDYVVNNPLPTDLQYFLPNEKDKLAKEGLGMLGAPRYVLMRGDNEVVCRACPKPDDPSLRKLIQRALK